MPRPPCLFVANICQFQWYHSPNLLRSERYITGSEFSNKMCAFQIKFNAYCLKRAVGHETKCCWPRNKLHRFQRFPIKILCSQSASAGREDNVKFDQQPLQKSASCWRKGSLGFHCLLPNAQRKVHVTWTFLCWGCKFVWFFKHIPSESETFLAMILFANWSGHTESFLSWLAASESQPPRVCEIFQPAVALRLSGEEHLSNVVVV